MKEFISEMLDLGAAYDQSTSDEARLKIVNEATALYKKDLESKNLVPFIITGIREKFNTIPLVDFKHQISDKVMAGIDIDAKTKMPIIRIFMGTYKNRLFKLESQSIMKVIEKLLKE